ncbi:MAG: hypothetical protein IJ087_15725, partial [Eggerthellaceae bacterium]|nr:hypothetical protein [Eggerthellaceae bacterium]
MNGTFNETREARALRPLTLEMLEAEEMRGYESAFEAVFSQPNVHNIALAGSPTANKSAVVNGWKATHEPERWLTVSVPHFNRSSSHVTAGEAEDALINQLVGQMDLLKSPKSRFRNLMKHNHPLDAVIGCVFAAFVALSIFLIWIMRLLPSERPSIVLCVAAFVAWLACIGFGVFQIVRTDALGRLLTRLRRRSADIELAAGPNDSRIERYMGDLVYVLNTNDFDNIVFEDLDSYRYLPMFERLRALCALANAKRPANRTPLRFFYLIGDGFFDDPHERARFFDYIIPVIPYVDTANVFAQFKSGLTDIGLDVDEDFLADLSEHIDDPNILRDIVNEAHQYKTELFDGNEAEGDTERLVALIAYKALFPRDFELLQNEQGYLYALLKSRTAIIAELRSRNARAAARIADELNDAQAAGDTAHTVELSAELEALERDDVECSRKSLAQLLASISNPEPIFANPPDSQLDGNYLESIVASPYFPFIRFAIGNGWIDGTYERFLSNFYAESITVDDRELISAVAQGAPVKADRHVDSPFSVMSHLDVDAFALESARVYALLTHLLTYGPADKLESLFRGIGHDDDLAWLLGYTESPEFDGAVFAAMEAALEEPVERILADEDIDIVRRRRFTHRLLSSGAQALERESVRTAAREFAHDDPRFLAVDCVAPMSIAEGLSRIGYRPGELDCAGCDQDLLQYVYAHDLYDPTAQAIDDLLANLLDVDPALPGGYLATRVYSLTGTAVKEVVEDNAERFVSTLLDTADGKLTDSAETVAWVLNLEDLPPQYALGYLKALSDDVVVDWLATVENYTYQGVLLDRRLVAVTPANILDYYTSAGNIVDEHLAKFLEANPFPAEFTMATTEEHLGSEAGFLKAVIECPELSDEKVDEIATTYRAQFNHFDMEGLAQSRVEMLVRTGVIRTTADNLRFVRKECPSAAKWFAKTDVAAYIWLVLADENGEGGECGFVRNEALDIFEMRDVDDDSKVALLAGFSEAVPLSADYPNELNAAIASRNFSVNDLGVVDEMYARGNRKLKRALAEAVVANRAELAGRNILLSMDMVADVAWRMRDDRAIMMEFIASQLVGRDPEPSRLEVRNVFERANLKE